MQKFAKNDGEEGEVESEALKKMKEIFLKKQQERNIASIAEENTGRGGRSETVVRDNRMSSKKSIRVNSIRRTSGFFDEE